jgi:hypothetical protein
VLGPLFRVKLKSGGASVGGALVVFELTELDAVEDVVVVVLEDVVALEDVAALEDMVVLGGVEVLDVAVVLAEEVFCAVLG